MLALKGALTESGVPRTPGALAARFKGRGTTSDVRRPIVVLERDRQVRRALRRSYSQLRAARLSGPWATETTVDQTA